MNIPRIIKIFRRHQRFLITTHINPDPDALASELALAALLKLLKKKVTIVNENIVPKRLMFLPGARTIRGVATCSSEEYDVAVVVDCGDFGRVGKVARLLDPQKVLVNIDHHVTNAQFGDINLVKTKASSTSEIIFDLLRKARVPLTRPMAVLLYLGIMTDTGSFRYENTTAYTHEVVAQLMKFNFSVTEMYRRLYETVPLNDLHAFAKIINTLQSLLNGRVVCVELKQSIVRKFSESFDLRDKIFQYLRAIKGVEVIVILTEEGPRRTRVNMRSHGKVNVARLAYHFKGGGHRRASGCLVAHNLKEAKTKILQEIRKVL